MHLGKFGKLSINIPWKQNFSEPTVIVLENVQIVLSMLKQSEWEYLDLTSFQARMKTLVEFATEKLEKLVLMMNKNDNPNAPVNPNELNNAKSGYVDRVLIKVLDNLHVKFKSVNIRIESSNNENNYNNFSLGLTLEEIYVVNTNEKWEPEFIDRNKKQNFNRNMYKLLKLSNFGMYLKCNETLYLSALKTKDEIQKEMRELFPVGAQKVDCVDYLIQPSKINFLNYIFLIYSFTNRENEASI